MGTISTKIYYYYYGNKRALFNLRLNLWIVLVAASWLHFEKPVVLKSSTTSCIGYYRLSTGAASNHRSICCTVSQKHPSKLVSWIRERNGSCHKKRIFVTDLLNSY